MSLQEEIKSTEKLDDVLKKCEDYAELGSRLAKDAVSLLRNTVWNVSEILNKEIDNIKKSNFSDNKTNESLITQLSTISSDIKKLPEGLVENINALSKTTFTITLFGKTMAGKSTLMEILTHGNGESIGRGAQRTTRDVRTYMYRGLHITDVPGIAAFEGKEDEDIAFEAAKKSDLILFLITNDGPQACEAECLKKVFELGKPVICIINVKADISHSTNFKIFERDLNKKFEKEKLDNIKNQFIDFGKQYGQNWRTINFAYVHLKSAFLSQQEEFIDNKDKLYKLSRFSYVERLIVNEICTNGSFYKLEAYTDIVVVPLVNVLETLFNQSAQNSKQGSILIEKRKKFNKWTEDFEVDGKKRIKAFLSSLSDELKCEIASFSEDNYDNQNASDEWNQILEKKHIEKRAEKLLKQLGKECEKELQEISREVNNEIKLSHEVFSDASINMDVIIDGKRIWNWATTLVSGGLMIAGLFLSGPIGWIGAGIGLFGWLGSILFSSREEKIHDARQKLEKKLSNYIDKMIIRLEKNMLNVLYNELLKKQLYPMKRTINNVISSIFVLSNVQQNFAIELNKKLQMINMSVVKEALVYLGHSEAVCNIFNIARIPGYAMMIILEDGKHFPDDASKKLYSLMKEKIWYVFKKDNLKSMLLQAIGRGCDRDEIYIQYIDSVPRIAHIPKIDSVDASTKNRVRMAQQITELLIMK